MNLLSSSALVDFDREPGIDAALRSGRGRWPGLIVEHLFDETLAPVASPALIERMGGPPETPAALARWPLLGDPGHQWQDWFAGIAAVSKWNTIKQNFNISATHSHKRNI